MATTITPARENWVATNVSRRALTIPDLPRIPSWPPGATIDLIVYYPKETLSKSLVLSNYIRTGLVVVGSLIHTHDDKANVNHNFIQHGDATSKTTGANLGILTAGVASNADSLHKHTQYFLDSKMPSVSGQSGKYLTNNGTAMSWATIDIPSPTNLVPYDGATKDVHLGTHAISAGTITGVNVTSGVDPGHTHTGNSLSGITIQSTNLAVASPITITSGYIVGIDQAAITQVNSSLTGMLKVSLGVLAVATAGVDYVTPSGSYVPYSGADQNVDISGYKLIATTIQVSSTTVVSNLNADYWDGFHIPALVDGRYLYNSGGVLSWETAAGGTDEKVKVSDNDTTANYLYNKVAVGDGITVTVDNEGGNEVLRFHGPALTGYVPYSGATTNVNLGTYYLTGGFSSKIGETNCSVLFEKESVSVLPYILGDVPTLTSNAAVNLNPLGIQANYLVLFGDTAGGHYVHTGILWSHAAYDGVTYFGILPQHGEEDDQSILIQTTQLNVGTGFTGDTRANATIECLSIVLTEPANAPLTVSSTTVVSNLNADYWDGQHLPALDTGKYLTNNDGSLSWGTPDGTNHNLLSDRHTDTTAATSPGLGSLIYGSASYKWAEFAGNSTATKKFLSETSFNLSWATLDASDIPYNETLMVDEYGQIGVSSEYIENLNYWNLVEGVLSPKNNEIITTTGVVNSSGFNIPSKTVTVITFTDEGINDAIDILGETGGEIHLLAGTYVVNAEIAFTSNNITIRGSGTGTVLFVPNNTNKTFNIVNFNSYTGCAIRDLAIDGNRDNQAAGSQKGINLDTATNIIIENVTIQNIYGVEGDGIFADTSYIPSNIYIKKCRFYNIEDDGLDINAMQYSVIEGNYFSECGDNGIDTDGAYYVTISNNSFQNIVQTAIELEQELAGGNTSYCTVTGNAINGASCGILVASGSYNTITGNTICDCFMGIYIKRTGAGAISDYNVISGNNIQGYAYYVSYGIYEATGEANYNIIIGNAATSCDVRGHTITGANTNAFYSDENQTNVLNRGLIISTLTASKPVYTDANRKLVSHDPPVSNNEYDASWAPVTDIAPSKQAVYNKIESILATGYVSDEAFGTSWHNVTTIAPSKNAVYDEISSIIAGSFDISAALDSIFNDPYTDNDIGLMAKIGFSDYTIIDDNKGISFFFVKPIANERICFRAPFPFTWVNAIMHTGGSSSPASPNPQTIDIWVDIDGNWGPTADDSIFNTAPTLAGSSAGKGTLYSGVGGGATQFKTGKDTVDEGDWVVCNITSANAVGTSGMWGITCKIKKNIP